MNFLVDILWGSRIPQRLARVEGGCEGWPDAPRAPDVIRGADGFGPEDRTGTCQWLMRGTVAPVARRRPPNGQVRLA